jgi:hypothetical protein
MLIAPQRRCLPPYTFVSAAICCAGVLGFAVVAGMTGCSDDSDSNATDAAKTDVLGADTAATDTGDAKAAGNSDDVDAGPTDVVAVNQIWPAAKPWTTPFAYLAPAAGPCPVNIAAGDQYGTLVANFKCFSGLDDAGTPTWTECSRANVGIPQKLYDAIGGNIAKDPQRLPHFHKVQENLAGYGSCWAAGVAEGQDAARAADHPMSRAVAAAARAMGRTVMLGGLFVLPHPERPLAEALRALHIQGGKEFDEGIEEQAKKVPMAVQVVAAQVLLGALAAIPLRDDWLAEAGHPKRYAAWFKSGAGYWLPQNGAVDPDSPSDANVFKLDSGYDLLFAGAGRLLQGIEEADLLAAQTDDAFEFIATTPYGAVVIRGGGDDTYEPEGKLAGDLLLVLDTGGDDTYRIRAGANTSRTNPVAVLIDLAGNDLYGYPEKFPAPAKGLLPADADGRKKFRDWLQPASMSTRNRQGAGRLGYGVLLDIGGGDDTYRSLRMSQGYANFGVGVLWDDGGDDSYTAEIGAQGAAFVGIAILHDGGGKDSYRAFQSAQAFGWMSSVGVLYDAGGDDAYECVVDEVLVTDSPQTPKKANGSLCQGTAFGLRRDKTKTHRSGGIALLRDAAGNDTYVGSTFAQGTGYWFGTGILADKAGNDTYEGLFYAQAASAHYAIGILLEGGGDDKFNLKREPINCTIGCGHDFSSALFIDEAGDDAYLGKSRAMGAAKCHGHGVFADNGGDDSYTSIQDKSIGWATDYDGKPGSCGNYKYVPSYGFFVDVGGKDTYDKPDLSGYGDNKTWINDDPDDSDALELSGGIDSATGDSYIHAANPKK